MKYESNLRKTGGLEQADCQMENAHPWPETLSIYRHTVHLWYEPLQIHTQTCGTKPYEFISQVALARHHCLAGFRRNHVFVSMLDNFQFNGYFD